MNPSKFILLCLAGWINREQQAVIEYLQEEVRVLKDHTPSISRRWGRGCRAPGTDGRVAQFLLPGSGVNNWVDTHDIETQMPG